MNRRRTIEIGALVWACVGAGIAFAFLDSVNEDARVLVGAASVVGPLAAVIASMLLARHSDRAAGAMLLASVVTPTYFAAALNLPALIVGAALVLAPRSVLPVSPPRQHQRV